MNREEKRQLVIKFFQEGKTMREISKVVHMSFGDIGSITRKENEEKNPKRMEKSQESQALKLFRKGKDPVDVVISLDLSPSKTAEIYKQFWELKGLYGLLQLYESTKSDISLLMKIHDIVKKYDLTKKDIINIVKYADEYDFLREEIEEMGGQFSDLLKQRRDTNDSLQSAKRKLAELTDQIKTYNEISIEKNTHIQKLDNEINRLEICLSQIKNNDEYYTKFEQFTREKLDLILKERRWILASAIGAVIESLKQVQFKEMIINNTINDEINRQKLLELSEILFDKILKQLIDVTMKSELKAVIGENNTAELIT